MPAQQIANDGFVAGIFRFRGEVVRWCRGDYATATLLVVARMATKHNLWDIAEPGKNLSKIVEKEALFRLTRMGKGIHFGLKSGTKW